MYEYKFQVLNKIKIIIIKNYEVQNVQKANNRTVFYFKS